MEILNNFGFEWILFFAQIVNFLIIYWLLKKFLYKPVLKLLEDRKRKITEGLRQAEESAKLLEETIQKEERLIKNAQTESKKIIDEARAQRDEVFKKTEEETKRKVELMLTEARNQIREETSLAEKRLESNVSRLAIEFLEKSLTGLFSDKEQEVVMKNAIKKLKNVN